MESVEFYGFSIECSHCSHIEYLTLKQKIESCVSQIKDRLKSVDIHEMVCHFVKVGFKNLTVCIDTDKAIHIGIYDSTTKSIVTHCRYDDISCLNTENINTLSERMENAISTRLRVSPALTQAWQELLYEQKKENELEDDLER